MKEYKVKYIQGFLKSETLSGVTLIIAAGIAMLLANINFTRDLYCAFLQIPVEFRIGTFKVSKNILLLINDALMTIFFLLVGLKVKRELIQGSLANNRQAVFPAIAAIGGMIVPISIYLAFNFLNPVTYDGWAIPAATDIAFALGVLALLGNRVSSPLKTFLMALAIIDDLGAIIIIAFFYSNSISILPLSMVVVTITILMILNIYNVEYTSVYLLIGVILWVAVLKAGIHPTLTGVIISFVMPLKEQLEKSSIKKLEYILCPWVEFFILPLFAFANAGISLQNITISGLISPLPVGIITGLCIGKPLGIIISCWLAIKVKLAVLPQGITWQQIMSVSVLCGIGFTMSIFISSLAFSIKSPELIMLAKLSILIASMLSAFVGYSILKIQLSPNIWD